MPSSPKSTSSGAKPPIAAVLGSSDVVTSLLFVFPLLLLYEAGVIFSPIGNGVDFITKNLWVICGYSRRNYLIVQLGLALVYAGVLFWARKKKKASVKKFLPMILEAAVWALVLGSLIVFVMTKILHIQPSMAAGAGKEDVGLATKILLSVGAGVHEELVFRLGLCAGGAALLRLAGVKHWLAMAIAFLVSSAVFSAVHHLGSLGDPWSFGVFTYRLLAGLVFCSLFYFRSFATAVYAHALYDVYVMVIHHS